MEVTKLQKDTKAAKRGVWFPFGETARVRIAQWQNKEHAKFLRDVGRKYGRRLSSGAMNEAQARKIMADQWQFVVTGLEGFTENGEPVEWSVELITRWAENVEYEDFFDDCREIAQDDQNYLKETITEMEAAEELGKESPTTSTGSTSGASKKKD